MITYNLFCILSFVPALFAQEGQFSDNDNEAGQNRFFGGGLGGLCGLGPCGGGGFPGGLPGFPGGVGVGGIDIISIKCIVLKICIGGGGGWPMPRPPQM